ncbi:MAG: hypothetical protein ACR2IV_09635 [Bryobacteraceae bacterium]
MNKSTQTLNLMSIRAAAKSAGVPYRRLLVAVKEGKIGCVKLSKHPLVSEQMLHQYIARSVGETA